jgi:hypothetical protein
MSDERHDLDGRIEPLTAQRTVFEKLMRKFFIGESARKEPDPSQNVRACELEGPGPSANIIFCEPDLYRPIGSDLDKIDAHDATSAGDFMLHSEAGAVFPIARSASVIAT